MTNDNSNGVFVDFSLIIILMSSPLTFSYSYMGYHYLYHNQSAQMVNNVGTKKTLT